MFSLPSGSDFRPTFFATGQGLEVEKFSTVLNEKCRNFSICFKETRGSLKKQMFLYCFMLIFAKTVDVHCIFDNMEHFRSFRSF